MGTDCLLTKKRRKKSEHLDGTKVQRSGGQSTGGGGESRSKEKLDTKNANRGGQGTRPHEIQRGGGYYGRGGVGGRDECTKILRKRKVFTRRKSKGEKRGKVGSRRGGTKKLVQTGELWGGGLSKKRREQVRKWPRVGWVWQKEKENFVRLSGDRGVKVFNSLDGGEEKVSGGKSNGGGTNVAALKTLGVNLLGNERWEKKDP